MCEVSSFQAEDAEAFAPDTALLLNVTEDHLDRHGSIEAYREAKLRVFANQTPEQVAVVPPGVEVPGRARRIEFGELPLPAEEIRLRGEHNLENAMGASAAAIASGVPEEAVVAALRTFPGVPHRLEEVGSVNGVLYVNDSKATNVSSAVRGIEAFDGGVHVILGGSLKGGSFRPLRQALATSAVAAYLIGEAADQLEAGSRGHAAPPPRRRPRHGGAPGDGGRRARATWCCSRPHAPASTSSATTRSVARPSGCWSRGDESGAGRRKRSGCPGSARSSTRSSTPPRSACSPAER